MRKIRNKLGSPAQAEFVVTLAHSHRQKSRGLLRLSDGSEAALLLEHGSRLHHGDCLLADDGVIVAVESAKEELSVVSSSAALSLIRAAYHLGNRHIPAQIEALRVVYLHDHVLDDMMRALGFEVSVACERFEPESGAYGRDELGHGYPHAHRASVAHAHDHHEHADTHSHAHAPASASRPQ